MTFETARAELIAMLDEEFERRKEVSAQIDVRIAKTMVTDRRVKVIVEHTRLSIYG